VDRALEAGALAGKPVMVDFFPAPERPYSELILDKLRPGDIHTHVFAQQFPILDDAGRVNGFMFRARERGVIFDLGHGAASFWFRLAAPAIRQGFVPDSISTDLHTGNLNGPVIDMQTTMNKVPTALPSRQAALSPLTPTHRVAFLRCGPRPRRRPDRGQDGRRRLEILLTAC
jgi:dihydroorotase